LDGAVADHVQHPALIVGVRPDVPADERDAVGEVSGHVTLPRVRTSLAPSPSVVCPLQSAYPTRSWLPERFRGGIAPSALVGRYPTRLSHAGLPAPATLPALRRDEGTRHTARVGMRSTSRRCLSISPRRSARLRHHSVVVFTHR